MNLEYHNLLSDYNSNTKHICLLNVIAFILIIIVVSPLNINIFLKIFIRLIIIAILSYSIFTNYSSLKNFLNIDLFSNDSLGPIKNNIYLNLVFLFLMIILVFYVFLGIFL